MITVNKRHSLPWHEGMSVRDVLAAMKYTFPHIIVVINGTIVRHDAYDATPVPDNADVRVVHMIAGG
ncbi:MAG: sulfur carrier protein ThiS [Anaerolineae bacterium]